MAVRVLIERIVDPDKELQLQHKLLQLRAKAMQAGGYISGETLRAVGDPQRFLVISTWNSLDDWKAWENNPERQALQEEIDTLLRAPAKVSVYAYA
ncbi:Quinol monooxygenase YgiN [Desulfacinum infernum DSM 9756]|jgi:heme-degrading monooxygenase HmoA|uniref:Quinol monooxygenase YgiN n=1 Tax=Desulfacinum infernum DSM 9756 TaxID=1121391 RepID=A0A1M4SGU2_9BACT|nr:antibiotic biosynthesis monooxygenase [Desulfacinum infernum]MBC7360258.1 antibiotic biosynthesis monooxygenase [Desulfacinum sp.]SHE31415.1 Quinol monooxygenase YgiN [Desulfacinum infernum DSM 9756]